MTGICPARHPARAPPRSRGRTVPVVTHVVVAQLPRFHLPDQAAARRHALPLPGVLGGRRTSGRRALDVPGRIRRGSRSGLRGVPARPCCAVLGRLGWGREKGLGALGPGPYAASDGVVVAARRLAISLATGYRAVAGRGALGTGRSRHRAGRDETGPQRGPRCARRRGLRQQACVAERPGPLVERVAGGGAGTTGCGDTSIRRGSRYA